MCDEIAVEYVDQWLADAQAFVEAMVEADDDELIAGWVLGDETLKSVPLHVRPSFAEFLAQAREAIEDADPLRRPVIIGMQSNLLASGAGGFYGLGARTLAWDDVGVAGEDGWVLPSWAELRATTRFLGREGRTHVSYDNNDDGWARSAAVCLALDAQGAIVQDATECWRGFGVWWGLPLDTLGRPRFGTSHVQSSFQFVRQVPTDVEQPGAQFTLSPHIANRSYAHHYVLTLRETVELNDLIADEAMSPTPWNGFAFFNAGVLHETHIARGEASTLRGAYRHDFWAGVHHAGGVFTWSFGNFIESTAHQGRGIEAIHVSRVYEEGVELIRAVKPEGLGLREALANGQRWDVRFFGEHTAGVPWLSGWMQSDDRTSGVNYGHWVGRTPFGDPFEEYLDLGTMALRLGGTTWLVITNSVNPDPGDTRWLRFQWGGTVDALTPEGVPDTSVMLSPTLNGWRVEFAGNDAIVLRLTP